MPVLTLDDIDGATGLELGTDGVLFATPSVGLELGNCDVFETSSAGLELGADDALFTTCMAGLDLEADDAMSATSSVGTGIGSDDTSSVGDQTVVEVDDSVGSVQAAF